MPGLGQQEQREQAHHLGLVGHQGREHAGEADALPAQVVYDASPAAGSVRAGVVDEVDNGEHGPQPLGQLVLRWHPVGDVGDLDLAFGADQTLGHGRLGDEEGPRHLIGAQPAEQPQRERHLRLKGQSRMAAGEDQPEPVVVQRVTGVLLPRRVGAWRPREAVRGRGPRAAAGRWRDCARSW